MQNGRCCLQIFWKLQVKGRQRHVTRTVLRDHSRRTPELPLPYSAVHYVHISASKRTWPRFFTVGCFLLTGMRMCDDVIHSCTSGFQCLCAAYMALPIEFAYCNLIDPSIRHTESDALCNGSHG